MTKKLERRSKNHNLKDTEFGIRESPNLSESKITLSSAKDSDSDSELCEGIFQLKLATRTFMLRKFSKIDSLSASQNLQTPAPTVKSHPLTLPSVAEMLLDIEAWNCYEGRRLSRPPCDQPAHNCSHLPSGLACTIPNSY
jgi:hypothetical protein